MANEMVLYTYRKLQDALGAEKRMAAYKALLPASIPPDRFAQAALSTAVATANLEKCTLESVLKAVKQAASLQLIIDGVLGSCYLVPFGNTCTLICGYRGLETLAMRSGKISRFAPDVIYEGDLFEYEEGTTPRLKHVKALDGERQTRPCIGAFAVAHFTDPSVPPAFCIMTAKELDAIKARSKSSAWKTDEDEMRKKSVVRRLCKHLPVSDELQREAMRGEYLEAGIAPNGQPEQPKPGFAGYERPKQVEIEVLDKEDAPEEPAPEQAAPAKEMGASEKLRIQITEYYEALSQEVPDMHGWPFTKLQAHWKRLNDLEAGEQTEL